MGSRDDPRQGATGKRLTRAEVAARLGVSTSTVRRLEGDKLHPTKDTAGMNLFDPAEVAALAMTMMEERPSKVRPAPPRNAAKLPEEVRSPGDIAAEVFKRLELRYSLAEIVMSVRVEPSYVRTLHREWQRGLIEGEMVRTEPVLPGGTFARARERHVEQDALAAALAELPADTAARISVARDLGKDEWYDELGGEVRRLVELGGFTVQGPIAVADLLRRYGPGSYRITASSLEPVALHWEVFTRIK